MAAACRPVAASDDDVGVHLRRAVGLERDIAEQREYLDLLVDGYFEIVLPLTIEVAQDGSTEPTHRRQLGGGDAVLRREVSQTFADLLVLVKDNRKRPHALRVVEYGYFHGRGRAQSVPLKATDFRAVAALDLLPRLPDVRYVPRAMIAAHAHTRDGGAGPAALSDGLALGIVLSSLLLISLAYVPASEFWTSDTPPHAPWCAVGEVPAFKLGFGELAQAVGSAMGVPTECEHGEKSSSDTLQATTTGVAVYSWCTNTPGFTRGQEHWMLTPAGLEHWAGSADPPRAQPIVRAPDLRNLCPG